MKEEVSKYSFYKSFYETIKKISNEDAGKLIKAINEYVFEDKEPEIGGIVEIIFPTIKAILKKDKTDRLNGHNGGRPKSKRGVSENQKGGLEKKENPALEKSKTNDNDNDNDKCKMINDKRFILLNSYFLILTRRSRYFLTLNS
ncbi:hypothetical protein J5751_05055, partial [bacterium]|nr:hypothetical protein [bacterium]